MTAPRTLTRNAGIEDLVALLRSEQPRKQDFVTPASTLRVEHGLLVVQGAEAEITLDGVTTTDGMFQPTRICDDGFAEKLKIPPGYLSDLRSENRPLFDANVNGRLRETRFAEKNYMVRTFRAGDGEIGVARAFLSDHFARIENLDVLMTVLTGIEKAGVPVVVQACDLTDSRMYVRVYSEQIAVQSPLLLGDYRSPYTGKSGKDLPMIWAGFEVSNSEVGHGAFSIAPRALFQVCTNGMTWKTQAIRAQHLGGQLPVGEIAWSEETQSKNLALIEAKAGDAVRTFLDVEWLQRQITKMEQAAGIELKQPEETIKKVASAMRYTEEQQSAILRRFIQGGSVTAGGVMHAVTAVAQDQTDADLASELEANAPRVLELAAQHA